MRSSSDRGKESKLISVLECMVGGTVFSVNDHEYPDRFWYMEDFNNIID